MLAMASGERVRRRPGSTAAPSTSRRPSKAAVGSPVLSMTPLSPGARSMKRVRSLGAVPATGTAPGWRAVAGGGRVAGPEQDAAVAGGAEHEARAQLGRGAGDEHVARLARGDLHLR